jgi:hypothetical protein
VPKRNNIYLFDSDKYQLKVNGDYWKWRKD